MREVAATRFADRLERAVPRAERRVIFVKLDWGSGVVRVRRIVSRDFGKLGSYSQRHIRCPICQAAFVEKWSV